MTNPAPDLSDEDEEFVSVFWGIRRHPIACAKCGRGTRTPSYWDAGEPSPPICGRCFSVSIWGI